MHSKTMFCAILLPFLVVPTASLSLRKIQSMDDHFASDLTKPKALPQDTIKTLDADAVRKAQKLWADEIKTCATPQSGKAFRLLNADASAEEADALLGEGPFDEFSDLPSSVWKELAPDIEAMSHVSTLPIHLEEVNMMRKSWNEVSAKDVAEAQDLLTTGSCKVTAGSQTATPTHTCELHNLYFEKEGLIAHVLANTSFPAENTRVRTHHQGEKKLSELVKVVFHSTPEEFARHLSQSPPVQHQSGTTLLVTPKWTFNIGHALYDSFYPGFVSLVQWGRDQADWRVLIRDGGPPLAKIEAKLPGAQDNNENLMGEIGGLGVLHLYKLRAKGVSQRFETLVLGVGYNMQKLDINSGFTLGAGRELNAPSLLRKKVYDRLGLGSPSRASPKKELQGIIVHNKRFGRTKPEWADELIKGAQEKGVRLQYIDWSKNTHPDNTGPSIDTFRQHMEIMKNADVHISGPGTAMMYQHFLRDGAVHINLGQQPLEQASQKFPKYMEEYMAEGAPYFKALYHWNTKGKESVAEDILRLVVQAKQMIDERYELPVPVGENLSPFTRVIQSYFYLTQNPEDIAQLAPIHSLRIASGLNLTQFSVSKCGASFITMPECHLDSCLLAKLMDSYGPPCDGCSWPPLQTVKK